MAAVLLSDGFVGSHVKHADRDNNQYMMLVARASSFAKDWSRGTFTGEYSSTHSFFSLVR